MKLKLGLAALLGATVLFARDIIVPASELPRNAQDFISKNFKTAQIALVKKDIDSYDVTLMMEQKLTLLSLESGKM